MSATSPDSSLRGAMRLSRDQGGPTSHVGERSKSGGSRAAGSRAGEQTWATATASEAAPASLAQVRSCSSMRVMVIQIKVFDTPDLDSALMSARWRESLRPDWVLLSRVSKAVGT
eukprot:2426889-Rhodomonas_salina.2